MTRALIAAAAAAFLAASAAAQHHHPDPTPTPPPAPSDHSMHHDMSAQAPPAGRPLFSSDMAPMLGMTPADPGIAAGRWSWHVLGQAQIGWNDQGGPSGADDFESKNWNMVMAQRSFGKALVSFMLMNSLEPWTVARRGSPELFQTGETFRGVPLVDRQHPHDLFMNLSATASFDLPGASRLWIQAAPVGEPALGPVAFMHRASTGENPTAPLGHHWHDSTHIAYNVVTAGWGRGIFAIEASAFRGAEPDEGRFDIDGGSIDSASGRATVRLPSGWSGQASYGYLHEPEASEPGDTHRTTASISYGLGGDRPVAASLVWGRNQEDHGTSQAFLLEGAWRPTARDSLYARAEIGQKDGHLLETKGLEEESGHEEEEDRVWISALTAGYARELALVGFLETAAGGDVTVYGFPSRLESVYGDFPVSVHVFLRLRWSAGGSAHGH